MKCDVLIVGGGLVGLSLAKGLELAGVDYLLVDKNLQTAAVTRPLALSKSTLAIFKSLDLWSLLHTKTTAIHEIHVSLRSCFAHVLLEGKPLAQVIDLIELQKNLKQAIQEQNRLLEACFESYTEEGLWFKQGDERWSIQAKLIVAADGAHSALRQACGLPARWHRPQTAYLSILDLQRAHHGRAYERFTAEGSIALLPWQEQQYAMVACAETADLTWTPASIEREFGGRFGAIRHMSPVQNYPIEQVFMPKQFWKNVLFIGNAAHALHPVAGQGLNLSLRDVAVFLEVIQVYGLAPSSFPYYSAMRRQDQRLIQMATHFLGEKFTKFPQVLQAVSLSLMAISADLKSEFSSYAQGLAVTLPQAVQEYLEVSDD